MARVIFSVVLAAVGTVACSDVESPTDLVPEGPPMVRQVFMREEIEDPPGSGVLSQRRALAYGTHPNALTIKHKVLSANPDFGTQTIRVVMDELLVGNYLEEISCRSPVDDDAYGAVPLGATPDDIARCATQADVLPQTCTGPLAVCLDPAGVPVGVLDENGDGAADDTQFIPGAVGIRCGDIDVPIDLQGTYWQPSGNQQVPAAGGLDALGPAIVLKTLDGLPVDRTCHVVFGDAVVDKGGVRVCAPQFGDAGAPDEVAWPPPNPCPDADTTATEFTVGPLRIVGTSPVEGDVGHNFDQDIEITLNTKIAAASLASVDITPTPPGTVTVMVSPMDPHIAIIHIEGGLARTTEYTVTIAPTDLWGGGLAAPFTLTFTTN